MMKENFAAKICSGHADSMRVNYILYENFKIYYIYSLETF